jgi:hypothetical protein
MIIGAHSLITSTRPDLDCAFLRNVLGLPNVDDGARLRKLADEVEALDS